MRPVPSGVRTEPLWIAVAEAVEDRREEVESWPFLCDDSEWDRDEALVTEACKGSACGSEACEVCAARPEIDEVYAVVRWATGLQVYGGDACVDLDTFLDWGESDEGPKNQAVIKVVSDVLGIPVGAVDRLVDVALRVRVLRAH